MFNLIVAVISIALIAAMAAASIFYGGAAFSSGTAQAQATTLINNGQQIGGAQQLHMIDNSGNRASVVATLQSGLYLQAVPTPPSVAGGFAAPWEIADAGKIAVITFSTRAVADSICDEVLAQGGLDVVAGAGATPIATDLGTAQYGCFIPNAGDGTSPVTFAMKL